MNRSHDHALLLIAKADEDMYVFERLVDDADSPIAMVGFHAQQAVEELPKAVLTGRGIQYGRTHDLARLLDLVEDAGVGRPPQAEEVPALIPYAVDFRYGQPRAEGEGTRHIVRARAADWVGQVRHWADTIVRQT